MRNATFVLIREGHSGEGRALMLQQKQQPLFNFADGGFAGFGAKNCTVDPQAQQIGFGIRVVEQTTVKGQRIKNILEAVECLRVVDIGRKNPDGIQFVGAVIFSTLLLHSH